MAIDASLSYATHSVEPECSQLACEAHNYKLRWQLGAAHYFGYVLLIGEDVDVLGYLSLIHLPILGNYSNLQ